MKHLVARWLPCLAIALLVGCSASPSTSELGSAQFAVSLRQDLVTSISRVSVTSSAADMPSVSVDLAMSNGVWGGILGNIPAGTQRTFLAQAFDASDTLLFEGSASGITVFANQTVLVAITLQQVNPPPPFQNEAPLIDSLVASSTTVPTGGSLSLTVTAHDPNPSDSLTYAWTGTAGTFSAASALSTRWTAPATTGIQTLTFQVTDSGGLSSSISLTVNVTQGGGQGDARLNISFNSPPRVSAMGATPTQLEVGQTAAVSVTSSDPDRDRLSYAWSATCAGTWTQATSPSARFTPTEVPSGACNNCNLTVTVSDGRGGQTTGTVALCVGTGTAANHFSPEIIRSYRSADAATPGQVLTFEVVASDPEGSALSFSWAAAAGTFGAASDTASASRITWTAPSCTHSGLDPTVTATVTNAFNLSATRSFTVTGLASCNPGWTSAGRMTAARYEHTATLLPDGQVLLAAGYTGIGYTATADLYDPASGTWSTTGSLSSPRFSHTATLLPNGKVLVVGGLDSGTNILGTAELYDPASGTWSMTGSMSTPRSWHTATLLPNGKVLVAGGYNEGTAFAGAEIYDPTSGTWSTTSALSVPRFRHTATLLPNGKVLVSGGSNSSARNLESAEVYDPASGAWSATGPLVKGRYGHTAVALPDGRILVSGGYGGTGYLAAAEVYNPASGTWSATGSMLFQRLYLISALLPNGKVLVSGGTDFGNTVYATAEIYNPALGTWSATSSMAEYRSRHTATPLPNGKVLISGGYSSEANSTSALNTTELYTP